MARHEGSMSEALEGGKTKEPNKRPAAAMRSSKVRNRQLGVRKWQVESRLNKLIVACVGGVRTDPT